MDPLHPHFTPLLLACRVQKEARAEGSVDKNVYWQYLAAWSPYFIIPVGMIAAGVMERSLQVCSGQAAC